MKGNESGRISNHYPIYRELYRLFESISTLCTMSTLITGAKIPQTINDLSFAPFWGDAEEEFEIDTWHGA